MGAISEGGVSVLNEDVIRSLAIPAVLVDRTRERERVELERRNRLYRGSRPPPMLHARTVILIDDGLATGSTMEAAILALRLLGPARIVAAAPVGARESCDRIGRIADVIVCPAMPDPFNAVGLWYDDFAETSDEEVQNLLNGTI